MAKAYCCDRCGDYFKSKVIREYVVGYPCGSDGSNLLDQRERKRSMTQFIFPWKLSGLELYQESGQYYMRVSYEFTAHDGTHEIMFPRVRVPFYAENQAAIEIETMYCSEKQGLEQWTIYGTDKWVIEPVENEDGTYIHYIDKLIKPAVEEIEKESEKESKKGGMKS